VTNTSNDIIFDSIDPPMDLTVLLLRSEKKRHFNRFYGDTQRRDFRLLEDKVYLLEFKSAFLNQDEIIPFY
jgi:hypothetical protein